MDINEFINSIPPSRIAKIRGRRIETSTRDKKRLMRKVFEIESIIEALGFEIQIKENTDEKEH